MSGAPTIGKEGPGDQRNLKNSEIPQPERYEEGKENSHDINDSSTRALFHFLSHTRHPPPSAIEMTPCTDYDLSTQRTSDQSPTAWQQPRNRASQKTTARRHSPRKTQPFPYVVSLTLPYAHTSYAHP